MTGAFLVLTDHVICLKSKWSLIKKQSKFVVLKNGCLKPFFFFFFPRSVFAVIVVDSGKEMEFRLEAER